MQADKHIGWLKFALQVGSVVLAYIAFSTLPVMVMGVTSASTALSSFIAMIGGIFVAWLWLRKEGRFVEGLGLLRVDDWGKTLALALLAIGGTLLIFTLGGKLAAAAGLAPPQVGAVMGFASESPAMFAMWIVLVAWAGAGFGEEVLWRGFLMDRLSRLPLIGNSNVTIIVVQAVIFGLAHAYQGLGGVLITGAVGLLFGWIRLRAGGVIWAGVIGHAAVDTIMLSLGYAEATGLIGG